MAVHGALAAFNPQEEDWSEYSERLSHLLLYRQRDYYGCKEESCSP